MNYRDLGFNSLGIKKIIVSRRLGPGETRNVSTPGAIHANSIFIGEANKVFKGTELGIHLGDAVFASAPFSVDMDGNLIATTATLTGYAKSFVSTLVWTATDEDTADWASGSILTSDGTTYSIDAGNTGNIAALTYIYLDPDTSTTVLQTSTTPGDSVGDKKLLIALVQAGAAGAKCIIDVVSSQGTTIDGDRITTGKIESIDGKTFFDLDGKFIIVNDGSNDRIIIGYQANGF